MKKLTKSLKVVIAALMLFSVVGCSGDKKTDKKKVLYYIPIVESGSYWSVMQKGAKDKAKELGYELVVKTSAPSEAQKNEKHIGFLQEAIAKDAAAIAIAPMDPDMFDKKVKEAKDAGIPVVTFDADVKSKENRVAYVGTDNKLAGIELGKQGAQNLLDSGVTKGSISLVSTNVTQTTMVSRIEGVKEGFKEVMGDDFKNFKFLEPIVDEDQSSVSKKQLEGQIVANKDLIAVFSFGSEGPDTGVMEALKSQKVNDKVKHFGFDYTPTWENGIKDNLITGIVDQDAYTIGQQVVQVMVNSIEGKEIESNYDVSVVWVEASKIIEYGKEKDANMDK